MTPEEEKRFGLYAQAAKDRGLFFNGRQIPYKTVLTTFARELRKNQTECERRVGGFLKKLDFRVRAQHPIDNYIVDFYIHDLDLVIEIDGEQHYSSEGKEYDSYRDEILRMYGLKVFRISNIEIRENFNAVCKSIRDCYSKQKNKP